MPTQIDQLEIEIISSSNNASNEIDELSKSLDKLRNSAKITTALNNLNKLTSVLNGLSATSEASQKLTELNQALSGLSNIQASGLRKVLNDLQKIPNVINKLDSRVISEFSMKMSQLNNAILPLATNLDKVGNGLSRLPQNINKANGALGNLSTSTRKASSGLFSSFGLKMAGFSTLFYKVGQGIAKTVTESNNYVETLNLFQTTMGDFYDEAQRYANLVEDKLGIDSAQWMQAQGTFMSMAKGFGVANDKAYQLSKGLTELSYDLSSFKNIKVEEALTKMKSGLAGEIEPLNLAAYIRESIRKHSELLIGRCANYIRKIMVCRKWHFKFALTGKN